MLTTWNASLTVLASTMSEVIECSIEETNRLRTQLGLAPLRVAEPEREGKECLELSVADTNALRKRLGLAPLKNTNATEPNDRDPVKQNAIPAKEEKEVDQKEILPFAESSLGETKGTTLDWAHGMRRHSTKAASVSGTKTENRVDYTESDLQGLHVGHALHELEEGSTTILTLADVPLLQTDDATNKVLGLNETDVALENVHLTQDQQRKKGLLQKRQVELGLAGYYADDDEFEELGGSSAPSRAARSVALSAPKLPRRGFQIGGASLLKGEDDDLPANRRFAKHAMSLVPAVADVTASDFMTVEEYQRESGKSSKKKNKRSKRHRRRRSESEDEAPTAAPPAGNLLDELAATAVGTQLVRRRESTGEMADVPTQDAESNGETLASKRARYDQVMNKGNERSQRLFAPPAPPPAEEEPDDAFLNAALEKARRFHRLKALAPPARGAESVAAALQNAPTIVPEGSVPFAVDETREFTRALFARAEQTERELARRQKREAPQNTVTDTSVTAVVKEEPMMDMDLQELSKQVKVEDAGFDGTTTGHTVPMGRGVGAMLHLLQGEMQRKHAGKEEMRGRAKDERTYEDYEPLDLSQVVRIDERNATSKDKELAHREIKLEYRDEHGRLLTRKEAFRELSYQFHGYGSGKRKQEKKLEQIAREQAEARLASRQVGEGASAGIFGALKETQKATGKAFVVHKTGM